MNKKLYLLLFLTLLLGILSTAWAATILVPADYLTIQEAITAASDYDVIDIAAGTYEVTASIAVNKKLTIQGTGIGQTIVQTAGTTTDPVSVFAVSADEVTLKLMTIKQRKTTNTSVESAVSVSTTAWPHNNDLDAFMLDSCRLESMEFCITVRGQNWTLTNSEFAYVGPLGNSNRLLCVYGNAGNSTVSENSFECSTDASALTRFIYATSSDGSEQFAGTLSIIGNDQTSGNLLQFYSQDNLQGTGLTLNGLDNTFNATNADFILYGTTPLNSFTAITLTGNNTSNAGGKGLLGLDGPGPIGSAGSTVLTMYDNVMINAAITKDGYAEATGSTGGLVGYKTAVFYDPNVTILGQGPVHNVTQDTYYYTIQAAINAANTAGGDVIEVSAGTYAEELTIDKALTINGADGAILDGVTLGLQKIGLKIKSGNVTFNNIDVVNFAGNGIIVGYEASIPGNLQNVHITNCLISNIQPGYSHGFGIYVGYESEGFTYTPPKLTAHLDYSGLLIQNNEITNTADAALCLQSITASTGTLQVLNNYIHEGDASGVWIDCARNIDFENNVIDGNAYGFFFSAIPEGWYVQDGLYGAKNINIIGNEIINNSVFGVGFYNGWTSTIIIEDNLIDGNPANSGVQNSLTLYLDASPNWWGDLNPADDVTGNVTYIPMWSDASMTTLYTPPVYNVTRNLWYETIQSAIDAANAGNVIEASAGTYIEDINVNKTLTVRGADAATTVISGPIGGNLQTVFITANDVLFENFTVTREGNNVTDWNNTETNQTGLQITNSRTGCVVQNCIFTGNRNAVYLNDNQNNTIQYNVIDFNRTGLQLVNNVSGNVIQYNEITNNWTMGVLFYYSGVVTPSTNTLVKYNNISGNWYSQIECKIVGTNPTTSYDCSYNWLGSASLNRTSALAGEPGYTVQIPVEYGGTSVNPGGNEGKITGQEYQKVICYPWYAEESMLNLLWPPVHNITLDTYHFTIQEAVTAAASGNTIEVAAGTYTEDVVIDKPLTLNGANANVDIGSRVRGPESIIQPATSGYAPLSIGSGTMDGPDNVTINGFEITAPMSNNAIYCGLRGPSYLNIIYNYIHHTGTARTTGTVYAINYRCAEYNETDINISHNYFDYIFNSLPTATKSSAAIWMGQSPATGIYSNVLIEYNTIKHVESYQGTLFGTDDFNTSGINIGCGWKSTGYLDSPIIRYNMISDLTGSVVYGISLQGNTPGAQILNNTISNLVTLNNPQNAAGLCVFQNVGYTTNNGTGIVAHNNSVTNMSYGIYNATTNVVDGTLNWWGHASGPLDDDSVNPDPEADNPYGQGVSTTGYVLYDPWWADETMTIQGTNATVHNVTQDTWFFTIQDAIDNANPAGGDEIQVYAGTYIESNILVDKSLIIKGINVTRDEVVIVPAAEDGNVDSAFGTNAQNGFIIRAHDVTIENVTLNGRGNPALTPGKNNFRIGIVTADASYPGGGGGTWNNLHVDNVKVLYPYRRGISVYPAEISGTLIENSRVEHVAFNHAMYISGQCEVLYNTIIEAFQGIVTAHTATTPAGLIKINGNNLSEIGNLIGCWGYNSGDGSWAGQPRAIQFNNSDSAGRQVEIKNNIISDNNLEQYAGTVGIYTRLANELSVVDNNQITLTSGSSWASAGGAQAVGMLLGWSYTKGFLVQNNTVNMTKYGIGVMIHDCGSVAYPLNLQGNTITSTNSMFADFTDAVGIYMAYEYLFYPTDTGTSYVKIGDSNRTDNTISGFVTGIRVHGINNIAYIDDNQINANQYGVLLTYSSDSVIQNNDIYDNQGYGIALIAATDNTIEANTISNNGLDAIALANGGEIGQPITDASTGNYVKGNTISSNRDGVFIGENCSGNYVTDGNAITATSIGISVWRPGNETITDNTITNCATGIRLLGSSDNTITGNTITANDIGIKADRSWQVGVWYPSINNTLQNNKIAGNTSYGVYAADNQPESRDPVWVDATQNWWGHASGPYDANAQIPPDNPDGQGDDVTEYVYYDPWWADEAMTIPGSNSYVANGQYSFIVHAPNSEDGAQAKIWGFYQNPSNAWVSATYGTGTFVNGYATVNYTVPADFSHNFYWEVLAYQTNDQTRSILWNTTGPWGQFDTYMLNGQTIDIDTYRFDDFTYSTTSASFKMVGANDAIPSVVDYATVEVLSPWTGSINDYDNSVYNSPLYRKIGLYPSYAIDRGYTVEVIASNPSSPQFQQIKISKPSIGYEVTLFGFYLTTPSDPLGYMWWTTFPIDPVSEMTMTYDSGTGFCSGTFATPLSYGVQYFIQPYAEINITGTDLVYSYNPGSMDMLLNGVIMGPVHNVTRGTFYSTIQAAIDDGITQDGDYITVAAGIYAEAVHVYKDLSFVGAGRDYTFINAPATLPSYSWNSTCNSILAIDNCTADITGFTIDGLHRGNGGGTFIGVHFWKSSGSITYCKVTGFRDDPLGGAQDGIGINVNHVWDVDTPQTVNIAYNIVEDYQKGGIVVNELGSYATIDHNVITGQGPMVSGQAAQNGIQIGYGAGGTITYNTISDNNYEPDSWAACAITLVGVDGVTITNNDISSGNEVGIDLGDDAYYGYGGSVNITVTDNIINDCEIGLHVEDNSFATSIANNNFSNYPIQVYGNASMLPQMQAILTGNTYDYAYLVDQVIYSGPVQNLTQGTVYNTIQAAITDAVTVDGDVIHVSPGIYPEVGQIVINKNLTIYGDDKLTTIVTPTANTGSSGDARGWWLVQSGKTLNLSNVTLDGAGYNIHQGIRSFGIGTIDNNIIKNMTYPTYLGTGIVMMGGNMTISNNEFSNIGRIGVSAYYSVVTDGIFNGNKYTGKGVGDWLDYGIEVGGGAVVTITGNEFTNCYGVASSDGSESAGILVTTLYGAGSTATVTNNNIHDNSYGMVIGYDETDTSSLTVSGNTFTNNPCHIYASTDGLLDFYAALSGNTYNIHKVLLLTGSPKYPIAIYNSIQGAIDDADPYDEIQPQPDTYAETLNIEGKDNLTITGSGNRAPTIIQPTTTLPWNALGITTQRRAAIRIVESDNLAVSGIVLDCELIKNNGYIGLLYANSTGGVIQGSTFKNMYNDQTHYYDVMMYARAVEPSYDCTNRATLSILANEFIDTGRLGIVTHNGIHTIIDGNTFYKTTDCFGYGMEIGSTSTAEITDNVIWGFDTPAVSDGSTSAGIYIENSFTSSAYGTFNCSKPVTIEGNEIYNCQDGIVVGNQFNNYAGNVDIVVDIIDNNIYDNINEGILITDYDRDNGSSVTANIIGNTITTSLTAADDTGIYVYAVGDGDISIDMQNNIISNFDYGLIVYEFGAVPSGSIFNLSLTNGNSFDELDYAIYTGAVNWTSTPVVSGNIFLTNPIHFYDEDALNLSAYMPPVNTYESSFLYGQAIYYSGFSIDLVTGWNLISSPLVPENADMEAVLAPLIDGGYLIKAQNETGNSLIWNGTAWINNIGDFQMAEGYYVQVNADCTLPIFGNPVSLPMTVTLNPGWNIITFPYMTDQAAMTILQPLIDDNKLVKVQNDSGGAIAYNGVFWIDTIGSFETGEGYYVKVNATTSITYGSPSKGRNLNQDKSLDGRSESKNNNSVRNNKPSIFK